MPAVTILAECLNGHPAICLSWCWSTLPVLASVRGVNGLRDQAAVYLCGSFRPCLLGLIGRHLVVLQLLQKEPTQRLPLPQVLEHPWIVANAEQAV
jgi:hypothetical protein